MIKYETSGRSPRSRSIREGMWITVQCTFTPCWSTRPSRWRRSRPALSCSRRRRRRFSASVRPCGRFFSRLAHRHPAHLAAVDPDRNRRTQPHVRQLADRATASSSGCPSRWWSSSVLSSPRSRVRTTPLRLGSWLALAVIPGNCALVLALSAFGLRITLGRQSLAGTSYQPDMDFDPPINILECVADFAEDPPKLIDVREER